MTEISENVLKNPLALFRQFEVIEDPRINRHKRYPLMTILAFAFVAILSDQQSWYQIYEFCLENLDWFCQYIDTSCGVPSHDTFRRVFSLIEPVDLEEAIIAWTEELRQQSGIKKFRVMILDGKALRGVPWKVQQTQLYVLNAWDAESQIFLGQMTIAEKTNEITAAPQLLDKFDLTNTVVSVDALMTQKTVAEKIVEKGGHYVMALKGNHGTLFDDISLYFSELQQDMGCWRTVEKNRGRVEIRTCTVAQDISWLEDKEEWRGLKRIFRVNAEVTYEGRITNESRYFLSDLEEGAKGFLDIARKHWSIENQLHRSLDVHFREDACQVHDRKAASNLSILRKIALSLLKAIEPHKKLILKLKQAAYSPSFRSRCLMGKI
jgi:predicted transposase YbfD/YdcC